MKNLSIHLLVTASILGLSAFAQADDHVVKVPEPLAGASELFKTAPTIANDAMKAAGDAADATAEKAGEMASDTMKAGEDAAEKAGEMAKDAMKATGDAADATAEKAGEMASDTMKAAKDAAGTVKVPEPLAGSEELFKSAPTIATEAPAMTEEKPEMAEEKPAMAPEKPAEAMAEEKPAMAEEKPAEAMTEEKPEMAAEKPAEPMASMEHTIAKGDTLWDLAKSKLGDATKYKAIIEANPGINPNNLKIGDGLKLPAQ